MSEEKKVNETEEKKVNETEEKHGVELTEEELEQVTGGEIHISYVVDELSGGVGNYGVTVRMNPVCPGINDDD